MFGKGAEGTIPQKTVHRCCLPMHMGMSLERGRRNSAFTVYLCRTLLLTVCTFIHSLRHIPCASASRRLHVEALASCAPHDASDASGLGWHAASRRLVRRVPMRQAPMCRISDHKRNGDKPEARPVVSEKTSPPLPLPSQVEESLVKRRTHTYTPKHQCSAVMEPPPHVCRSVND